MRAAAVMAACVAALAARGTLKDQPAVATQQAPGQAVYGRTCVTCHQANGRGMPNTFPPLAGSEFVNGDKARLAKLVLNGLTGPVTVAGQRFNGVMPPWKTQLNDADMAAVLTYVRSGFGNRAGPVAEADVRAQRAATARRNTPFTVAELR